MKKILLTEDNMYRKIVKSIIT